MSNGGVMQDGMSFGGQCLGNSRSILVTRPINGQRHCLAVDLNRAWNGPVQIVSDATADQNHSDARSLATRFNQTRIKCPPTWPGECEVMSGMLTDCDHASQDCKDQLGSTPR